MSLLNRGGKIQDNNSYPAFCCHEAACVSTLHSASVIDGCLQVSSVLDWIVTGPVHGDAEAETAACSLCF